jgi:DNA modification methylase
MKTNYLYNENCLDTMAKMSDNFIDLTVTSPPYDDLRTYNGYSFDFESIAKELYRVTKEGGVVVWVVGDKTHKGSETGTSFKQALFFKECGFNLHDTMIYRKTKIVPMDYKCNRYYQGFEYMFVFSKGKPKTCNYIKIKSKHAGKKATSINRMPNGSMRLDRIKKQKNRIVSEMKTKDNVWSYGSNSIKGHPAIFPEQLANDHIISWSNEGDLVYDCFMGSGTTAKMAIVNNRKWIGSEMSSEYCDIVHERLKQFDDVN